MGLFSKIKNLFSSDESAEDKVLQEKLALEKRQKEQALEAEKKAIEEQAAQKVAEEALHKKQEAEQLKQKETIKLKEQEEKELQENHLAEQKELEALREKEASEKKEKLEREARLAKEADEKIQKQKATIAQEDKQAWENAKEKVIVSNDKKDPAKSKEDKDLSKGLEKTKAGFFSRLSRAVVGKSKVDDEVLDDLEGMLIEGDVGVQTTLKIIEAIESRVAKDKYVNTKELNGILREEITKLLLGDKKSNNMQAILANKVEGEPYVIMVVGVNGVGKTTTIGKLANGFKEIGMSVVLGAADTFRAAAVDQIKVWGERVGVPVVAQKMGSDPASVAYDTLQSAKASNADIVLIDTAGRLHNQIGLMNELSKIRNVMKKVVPSAPHEVLLVLDASTGQNAIEQAKQFTKATDVNALALTKLDGTAKGGVVIGISDQFQIPVKYIGVGEGVDHLQVFDKKSFVDTLFA